MNICILAGAFHPKVGGAETYARSIAEGLNRAGHKVFVITDGVDSDLPQYDLLGNVQILRASSYLSLLNNPEKIRWEQMYFSLLDEIQFLLNDYKLDIIHANTFGCAIIGSMIALSKHVPLICSFHEQEPEKDPFGEGKCRLVFSKLPIDKFVAGSKFYYDKAYAFGVDETKIRLIYHGVDLTRFYPRTKVESQVRSGFGVRPADFFVVCAARLKERKGLLELVRAVHKVKDTIRNIRVLIAGSCNSASRDYADTLNREIVNLGLTDIVRINETLVLDDMPNLYAAANLVVQPSFAEGLGLALLEAMAMNKPVIGTEIPGIRESIIHEQNGLLVPPGTVEPLAEAIVRLATNQAFASQLAEKGLSLVKSRFDINRTISETVLLYQDLVSRKGILSSLLK